MIHFYGTISFFFRQWSISHPIAFFRQAVLFMKHVWCSRSVGINSKVTNGAALLGVAVVAAIRASKLAAADERSCVSSAFKRRMPAKSNTLSLFAALSWSLAHQTDTLSA